MYSYHKLVWTLCLCLVLNACSTFKTGFLGLAPLGDRQEYIHARDLFNQGKYQQAIVSLRDYIYKTQNVKRREARAYRLLGQSYEHLNQLDNALETYLEALEFHPQNASLLMEAGHLYRRTNLYEQSAAMYRRALKADPNQENAVAGLAENYVRMGFFSKAREYYDRYFAMNPSAPAANRARYAYTFLQQRDYANALIHITMALSEEARNPNYWFLSAKANRGLGNVQAAMEDLDIALFLAPYRTDILGLKALWLYQGRQFNESLQAADQLLANHPDNGLGLLIRYLNLTQLHRPAQAQAALRKIRDKDGNRFIYQIAQQLL